MKDDSCSTCAGFTDNQIYSRMWSAIQASGRPMVLTVEGDPDDATITHGGFGNAKRVGHDISPQWMSMVSLVDIGAGLWPFAHNSTNATVGVSVPPFRRARKKCHPKPSPSPPTPPYSYQAGLVERRAFGANLPAHRPHPKAKPLIPPPIPFPNSWT